MELQSRIPPSSPGAMVTHMRALCTELWNLRAEGAFCDVVLIVQGEPVSAHSVILSACSPHLKKLCMDRSSITPSGAVSIYIDDYSYKVCLKTLQFLYTGERESLESTGLEKEFENLAIEWKLFGSAYKLARCEEETHESLMEIGNDLMDCNNHKYSASNETGEEGMGPRKKEVQKNVSKRKSRMPRKKKIKATQDVDHDNTNYEGTLTIDKAHENSQMKKEEERSIVHEGKLELHSNKRKAVKEYQEVSDEDDFELDQMSDINTDEEEQEVKEQKSKANWRQAKGQRVNQKKGTVKKAKNPGAKTCAKGLQRGRRNRCYRCDIQFDSREEYLAHSKEVHPRSLLRKQGLTCKVCNKRFYHYNLLQMHKLENHFEEGMKPARLYQCDFEGCTYSTSRYANYNFHRKGHTAETCICDICGKTMKNRYSLKSHVEIIHERKQERYCEKCDKTFSTRCAFKNHNKNMHLGNQARLFCSLCGYSCKQSLSLKEHMLKTHDELLNANVFSCSICDFKTTSKGQLQRHTRTHNRVERLPCDECGKSYTSPAELRQHKRIHNNTAKIYNCNYCEYKTVYGVGSLRQHVRCMHKDQEMKPWKCSECNYAAMTSDSLSRHNMIAHGHTLPDKPPAEPKPMLAKEKSPYKKARARKASAIQNYPPQQQQPQQQQPQQHQLESASTSQVHEKEALPPELIQGLQPLNRQPSSVESGSLPNIQNNMTQQEPMSRQGAKALPSMPIVSQKGAPCFVDVPLNYSLFRSAANPTFPYDRAPSGAPQVLMSQTQMGQAPTLPGNMNIEHGWGDFQSF